MDVIRQVVIMFLLIAVGFLSYKLKIIDSAGTRALSSVVIHIANPATLFIAFQLESDVNFSERITGLGLAALLSVISLIISVSTAFLLIRGENKRKAVEQLSLILTNCGFMGIPLVRGVLGDEGVFYLAAFIAVNNLAVWTLGVIKMQGGRVSLACVLNTLKSPPIIAIALGAAAFILRVKIPGVALETIGYAANLTTPLAMLTAGASIACVDLKSLLKKSRLIYISFLRLIIIPLLTYASFLPFKANPLMSGAVLAAAACPSAAMCVILAVRYGGDSIYASEIFAATTLLSMITLPVIMALPL